MVTSEDEKKELLKQVFWDYNVQSTILLDILEKRREKFSHVDRNYIINRCFNYLNWYKFVSLFNTNELPAVLQEINYNEGKFKKIGSNTILGLEFAKRFLHKQTLPSAG